ncbi:MAG: DMT family transporter [Rhodospirillales bacterium]
MLMLGAAGIFCVSSVCLKQLAGDYTVFQVVTVRTVFALSLAVFITARAGGVRALKTGHPFLHLGRSVIGFFSISTFFFALQRMPIADAMTAAYCAPLFITALSVPLLKERVGRRRWTAVAVGFAGVAVVAAPEGAFNIGLAAALASALSYSLTAILIRKMSTTETMASVSFYTAVIYLALGLCVSIPLWEPMRAEDLPLFAVIGVAGAAAQLMMTASYRAAPVAVIAPFEYTSFVWALAFDFIIFNLSPSWATLAGAGIIIASGLYIVRREDVRKAAPVTPPAARTPMGVTFNDPQTGRRKQENREKRD